ncbi:MAG: glycerophosphodiester phosphodiesterase [Myxococcaceae bacterium]|nr:glycerophosphodiester phosphodiesterase [Myxococcaceae bacterium]
MEIWAHRGASADFPENTLEAFQGAVDQGADGVELDVMRCASGELVVCHDESLERLAHLPWQVAQTRWWKLKRADVGAHRGMPARLPLLEEVLSLVPFSMRVNVELKCDTLDDRGLAVEVAACLRARGERERIIVSSFNPFCLVRFAAAAPHIERGWLIDPDKAYWPQAHLWLPLLRPAAVHPFHGQATPERVAGWQAQGRAVNVWTVDDPDVARDLRGLGVAAVITNRPGALRAELRR